MLKDKINDDNNSIDNHTHFMEQAFNKCYPCGCGLSCMKAHFDPEDGMSMFL